MFTMQKKQKEYSLSRIRIHKMGLNSFRAKDPNYTLFIHFLVPFSPACEERKGILTIMNAISGLSG